MAKEKIKAKPIAEPRRAKSIQLPWLANVLDVVHTKLNEIADLNGGLRDRVDQMVENALWTVVNDKHFSIEPTQRVNLFLSYLRSDEELVTSYFDKLDRSPYVNKVFIDTRSIDAGEDIGKSIESGLNEADVVLLALTRKAAESYWVMEEIKNTKAKGKLLIPILLDESLLYDHEVRKTLAEKTPELLDLLSVNCIRAFSMLPCEVIHHLLVNAQYHSGIVGRVTALRIMASYDITADYFQTLLKMVAATYRGGDIRLTDIEQAIRVGEGILLSNRVQNDTSEEVLGFLINFYLLRNVFNVGTDIETRNTYDNVIKLLFRLIHKRNPLPGKKYSFEPQKAHQQDLELLFRVAQVLVRKNNYVEAFRICEALCRHPDISIPANASLRSVITYTAVGLAYEIEMYKEYYVVDDSESITFEKARGDLTGDSYMDLNLVARIVQSTKRQFETFGTRDLTQPWNFDNVFSEITNPNGRPKFVGQVDATAAETRENLKKDPINVDPNQFLKQPNSFHNIVYLFTEFAKQMRSSLNMIGFSITSLDAPWLMTTMGEVEDFFIHDSGNSVEAFYNSQLRRNMRSNYGEQASLVKINYRTWVELDYRTRVRQLIYASFYNSLKNLYRAGLFDGEDMTKPSAEILEKELRKLYCAPDLSFDEIPWHEPLEEGECSFLRRFQYQAVYIITELSLYLECEMPLKPLTINGQNVNRVVELITAFWHEKIKNPELLFKHMQKQEADAEKCEAMRYRGESDTEDPNKSPTEKKEPQAHQKFETLSPQQKLGYQVLFSILATLRKVSYTRSTVQIVKDKICDRSTSPLNDAVCTVSDQKCKTRI